MAQWGPNRGKLSSHHVFGTVSWADLNSFRVVTILRFLNISHLLQAKYVICFFDDKIFFSATKSHKSGDPSGIKWVKLIKMITDISTEYALDLSKRWVWLIRFCKDLHSCEFLWPKKIFCQQKIKIDFLCKKQCIKRHLRQQDLIIPHLPTP